MKKNKIIYWIATGIIAAGMAMAGFMYLSSNAELVASYNSIHFPLYLVPLLGIFKLLGAVALAIPTNNTTGRVLKEWAYAGFGFMFIGAIWVHVATGTPFMAPAFMLVLLAVSYIFHKRLLPVAR